MSAGNKFGVVVLVKSFGEVNRHGQRAMWGTERGETVECMVGSEAMLDGRSKFCSSRRSRTSTAGQMRNMGR